MAERKAVALLSGGLDSILAVRLILDQGIKVTALRFLTHFGCDAIGGGSCGHDVSGLSREMGFELKHCHLGEEYVGMVKNPRYGWGKNMNPCIDCRIMMLRSAREFMEVSGASFLFTGEVVGQRPMSQRRDSFPVIDRDAGLKGYILRPLSAKLLPITIPEAEGIVDRSRLMDISGRSRKRQYELAARFGITEFGQPAGGCLLTEPNYSVRLRDLFAHVEHPGTGDINLLRLGRHFRPNRLCKIVVGRNELENRAIEGLVDAEDVVVQPVDFMGPATIVRGRWSEMDVRLAAQLTVRYGDVEKGMAGTVETIPGSEWISRGSSAACRKTLTITGADDTVLTLRIEKQQGKKKSSRPSQPAPAV
ncbi:MAG: hypothetical protein A2Z34_06515 [Planctomycetes bacterium RBG_16_59_8]|nr:MAG: hypothetical protein A2Z34_06515 [Planctomycetes bacterium RBG_16_59_8]